MVSASAIGNRRERRSTFNGAGGINRPKPT